MRPLRCREAVLVVFIATFAVALVAVALVVTKLPMVRKVSAGNLPITFLAVARNDTVFVGHSPPPKTVYGSHNFRRPNRVITEYDKDVAARLATLVERRSTAADPDLIRLIVDMLDPPSTRMIKLSIGQVYSTPQSREVDSILKKKVGLKTRYKNAP